MSLTRAQNAVLHVAKKALCLDDDSYRDALLSNGGARSARGLDYQGFCAVMRHFERCGFKRATTKAAPAGADRPGRATQAQLRKIYASWWALGASYYERGQEMRALRGFLKKRFRVDHENFLTFRQAHAVIEAIKRIGTRTDRRATG